MYAPRILSIPETVFYNESLSPRELKIWVEVYQFQFSKFFASADWISKKTGIHIKRVYSAVKRLIALELLESYEFDGKRHLIALVPEEGIEDIEVLSEAPEAEKGNQMVTEKLPSGNQKGNQMVTSLIYNNLRDQEKGKSSLFSFEKAKELLPQQLKTEACFLELNNFLDYRKTKLKNPITEQGFKILSKKIKDWTPELFCLSVDNTIMSGKWIGLFLPKTDSRPVTVTQTRPKLPDFKPSWQNDTKADPTVAQKAFAQLRANLGLKQVSAIKETQEAKNV